MARVYVTHRLPGDGLERLGAAGHAVEVHDRDGVAPREAVLAGARDADALLCTLSDPVDGELLDACPELRIVANYGVGYDNIDVAAADARGVLVSNTPGVLTDATADLAFALLLAAARRLPQTARDVVEGRWGAWEPDAFIGHDVRGATLGIVGAGRIGEATAQRGEAFGMEILRNRRSGGTPLEELLERADYVSLHAPLTPETRHLIDAGALARMKPTAILVNTARGPLVDTDALVRALHDGQIAGAALDVTDPEPLPPEHPLLAAPNVLVVPHIGSAEPRTRARMTDVAVDNVLAALAGEPLPNRVEPPRG